MEKKITNAIIYFYALSSHENEFTHNLTEIKMLSRAEQSFSSNDLVDKEL